MRKTPRGALLALSFVLGVASCGGAGKKSTKTVQGTAGDAKFAADADVIYGQLLELEPRFAVWLGLHEFDGRMPDWSAAGIDRAMKQLDAAKQTMAATPLARLTATQKLEHAVLSSHVNSGWYALHVERAPFAQPHTYIMFTDFAGYISRDYAPAAERARSAAKLARELATNLGHAQKNLDQRLPRPSLMFTMKMAAGMIDFLGKDLPAGFAEVKDKAVQLELAKSLQTATAALGAYVAFLQARMPDASDDFALGERQFLAMLEATEGVKVDLATLKKLGEADLARNWAALEAAARQIDPARPVREVVADVTSRMKPAVAELAATGQQMVRDLRAFVVDKQLATIPAGAGDATVALSPSYMRMNMAFLRSAGVFDQPGQPSYYYVSPPDPSWPEAEQQAYIPGVPRLFNISAHEVWPGHYLAYEHRKRAATKILQSFQSNAMSEGWAHYCEELVMDESAGGGEPEYRIAQLLDALMRNVRFLAAIGLHTEGMTLDQATAMFTDKALQDPGTSRQQAMRGTIDPMYLNYTLGKLIIKKLRSDVEAAAARAKRPFSLRAFHDELLGHGNPPLPALRELMLGPNAGPVL